MGGDGARCCVLWLGGQSLGSRGVVDHTQESVAVVVVEGEVWVVWVGDVVGAGDQCREAVGVPSGEPRYVACYDVVGAVNEWVALFVGARLHESVGKLVVPSGSTPP